MHKLLVKAALLIALSLSAPAMAQSAQIPVEEAPASAPASAPAPAAAPSGPITPRRLASPARSTGRCTPSPATASPCRSRLQILLLMSLLTVLPSILLMMTSFTRIIIVLSILRQAIGLQQTPPNQVLVGLSLFLSLFVMRPVIDQISATAYTPYGAGQISIEEAVSRSGTVLHGFMIHQTRETDLMLFANLAHVERFQSPEAVPFTILLPAYVTSELKTAFQIGFLIFLPFLIIDPRRLLDPDVIGHDDALPNHRLDAVQAVALRDGRRLGADHGLARPILRAGLATWRAIISSAWRSRPSGSSPSPACRS